MKRLLRVGLPLLAAAIAAFAVASAEGAKAPPPPGKGPKLTITPTTATFGPVAPGVGASQEFVLGLKDGTSSGGLTVTVGGAETFAVTADTCTGTAISTSRTCTVTVTYTPSGYGQTAEGTLTATGKKDVKPAVALLAGSSTAAQLVSATAEINFGEEQVGESKAPLWIDFTNNATETLSLAGLDAPDGFAPTTSSWMTCTDGLAPGASCWGAVVFNPASAGYYEGSFTTTWVNGANETVATTSTHLTGTGVAPTLPGLSINDAPWVYSNDNATVTFTVTMDATSGSDVTFQWTATDDSAYWGNTCDKTADYTSEALTGTGTITAGQTTTTITFGTCNDGPANVYPITTPTYFTVTISNPSGATITTDTGKAEIRIS